MSSCTCRFCSSPCVKWNTSTTTVVLPIAVRLTDDVLGVSVWAWLVNFDGDNLWIKCLANVNGMNVPYTFENALEATNAVCGYVSCSARPPQQVTDAEKMWHFKTHEGFRSIFSLRSTNVSVIVSESNTDGLDFLTINCLGSSYSSVQEEPKNPVHTETTSGMQPQCNKRQRISASSKRKQRQMEQSPPPTSPPIGKNNMKHTPYEYSALGGNKDVERIATEAKMPWSTETIEELLTNCATIPLVKVSNELQGRYGFVECSFALPDGTVVHNVWLHINLLAYRYRNRIEHLL